MATAAARRDGSNRCERWRDGDPPRWRWRGRRAAPRLRCSAAWKAFKDRIDPTLDLIVERLARGGLIDRHESQADTLADPCAPFVFPTFWLAGALAALWARRLEVARRRRWPPGDRLISSARWQIHVTARHSATIRRYRATPRSSSPWSPRSAAPRSPARRGVSRYSGRCTPTATPVDTTAMHSISERSGLSSGAIAKRRSSERAASICETSPEPANPADPACRCRPPGPARRSPVRSVPGCSERLICATRGRA